MLLEFLCIFSQIVDLTSMDPPRPNTAMAAMGSRGDIYKANQTLIGEKVCKLKKYKAN